MKARVTVVLGMAAILAVTSLALGTTRTFDFDSGYGTPDEPCSNIPPRNPPMFNRPGYGYQTAGYVDGSDACGAGALDTSLGTDSLLTDDFAVTGSCNEIRFSWTDPTDDKSWLRVPTYKAGSPSVTPTSPNPTVHLGVGSSISMKIMAFGTDGVLGSEAWVETGQLEIGLCIRETGLNVPLGNDGGDSGTVEFVGIDSKGVTGDANTPVGGIVINSNGSAPPGEFTTVKWTFVDRDTDGNVDGVDVTVTPPGGSPTVYEKSIVGFSGDGILSAPYDRGVLCDLAIRKPEGDDTTKKWYVDIDDIVIDAPSVSTEPVAIQTPLNTVQTSVTVTTIAPTATAVNLYVTPEGGSRTLVATHTGPFPDGTTTFTGGAPDNLPPADSDFLRLGDTYEATQVVDGLESPYSAAVTVLASAVVLDAFDTYTDNAAFLAAWPFYGGTSGVYPPVLDINNVFQSCPNAVKCPGGIGSTSTPERRSRNFPVMQGTDAIPLWIQWKTYMAGSPSTLYSAGRHYLQIQAARSYSSSYAGLGPWSATSFWNWCYRNTAAGNWVASSVAITFNTWHTLAIKITTSNIDFYVDGTLIGSTARNGLCSTGFGGLVLGGPYAGGSSSKPCPDTWFDNICASYGATPVDANPPRTAMVTLLGPLPAGATTVKVSGVDGAATSIKVYDGATVIGEKTTDITAGINDVTVTALANGHSIQASQTVAPLGESCLSAPIVVGSCSPVPALTVSGPLTAGQTTVTVTGVKTSQYPATEVRVYGNGTLIGTAPPPTLTATTVVTVTPLVAGQTIKATQVVNTIEGCTPTWGPVVGSGANGGIYLTLGIKENSALNPGPQTIGADGTTAGQAWEWIGSTTRIGTAPVGKLITPSPDWQTVTFDPATDPIMPTSLGAGNGVLDGTYGIIEHLGITTAGTDPGPYTLYIDNVENSGVTFGTFEDPPYLAGTNSVMFRQPSFSGTTSGNIWTTAGAPNYSRVDGTHGDASAQSLVVGFQFLDNDPSRWIRLTTASASGGLPNPIIDLTKPTTFRILLAPACKAPTVGGPLAAGQTTVSVIDVDATASTVTVYANGSPIGSAAGNGTTTGDVPVTALVAGQSITATQTLGGTENCPSAPAVVGTGENAAVLLTLGIRENTALTGPVGADGGTTGPIEWLGAATKIGGAPQGKLVSVDSAWHTVTFTPGVDPVLSFNGGNNVLEGTYGVLEHVAISSTGTNTGPYKIYIDNVSSEGTTFATFESYSAGEQVMFQEPSFSSTTLGNLLNLPNVSAVDDTTGDASAKSARIEWQFVDLATTRWLRLTTSSPGLVGLSNPQVNLTQPITLRVKLAPACSPPTVTSITPDSGVQGNGNRTVNPGGAPMYFVSPSPVHVVITGAGFDVTPGATTVRLVQAGHDDLVATNVVVTDANTIQADINLGGPNEFPPGYFDGVWDVVVTTCADSAVPSPAQFTVNMCFSPPQDGDGDGDVDLSDFGAFQGCFNGPNRPYKPAPVDQRKCACMDVGDNPIVNDIDLSDFNKFQGCFNGPNRPPKAGC